ncbi:hypothetical protein MMC10_004101 [Thelotrema lepadinum]|nr:hypothetical protein [Thelotrema lepadinum]
MSKGTSSKAKKNVPAIPQPSASVILLSPSNQILLLHRVRTSSAFPSAHVFPGGNLSEDQDGPIPPPESPLRHVDSEVYRRAAIRECFEESGILLACTKGGVLRGDGNGMLQVPQEEKERARKDVHANRLKFAEWVDSMGGELDVGGLIPFTRWITPPMPRRFTTQMYLYFLPLSSDASSPSSTSLSPSESIHQIQIPTSDGGVEHTTATFEHASTWLSLANPEAYPPDSLSLDPSGKKPKPEIILFPPQLYLLHRISPFLPTPPSPPSSASPNSKHTSSFSTEELSRQRRSLLEFITDPDEQPAWGDKCISPTATKMIGEGEEKRSVLLLNNPGLPELMSEGREGDRERVVYVRFAKEGPRRVEIKMKGEWEKEMERSKGKEKL